jgi:hypothetical protein
MRDAWLAQSCVPDIEISGNGILLDGDCEKIVRRKDFYLGQNAPNPVAAGGGMTTVIPFAVTGTHPFSLELFDLEGRQIATLAGGIMEKGAHSVRYSPVSLPKGTYIIVLREGENVRTRNMQVCGPQ